MANNAPIHLFGHPHMQIIVKQRDKPGVAGRTNGGAAVCLAERAR